MRVDRTGKTYGNLTVLQVHSKYKTNDYLWLCRCSCGNLSIVKGGNLQSGHTKSCGKCNRYKFEEDYVTCITKSGKTFIFSKEDYGLVSKYCWSVDGNGYVNSRDGIKLHRLIMCPPIDLVVDHINGNPSDNRRSNLRISTQCKNTQNSKIPKSSTTGYKGVCWDKRRNKYMASIHPNGRTVFLGYYKEKEEAAIAYDRAASFYFGEYARLNFNGKEETVSE